MLQGRLDDECSPRLQQPIRRPPDCPNWNTLWQRRLLQKLVTTSPRRTQNTHTRHRHDTTNHPVTQLTQNTSQYKPRKWRENYQAHTLAWTPHNTILSSTRGYTSNSCDDHFKPPNVNPEESEHTTAKTKQIGTPFFGHTTVLVCLRNVETWNADAE